MTTSLGRWFGRVFHLPAQERPATWLTRVTVLEAEQPFDVVFYRDEGDWYVAEVPELPGCVTQGRTRGELLANVREAIGLTIESRRALGLPEREDLADRPAPVFA